MATSSTVDLQPSFSDKVIDNASINLVRFIRPLLGLLLLSACIYLFNIEKDLGLFTLMQLIVPGFIVYVFLPVAYRMPFFTLLNLIGLGILFGWLNGIVIAIFTLSFVGITSLPIKWGFKALLSLALTLLLVGMRLSYFPIEGSVQVAKIVGVLLMFRSILYLYELQHEKSAPSIWMRINYFLLLPNLIFFIFPIVDYKTFLRTYYEKTSTEVYEKGIRWMFRGVTHFLAYRLLYYYVLPAPSEVTDIYSLLLYFCVSYALILRLSGIFHFSAGVICLFGFDLPKTFDNYFLATSFSDLWRRINIYWKDFVMKVFYFPIYFKFKKRNETAVFITILIVFFFNWFFHAYQWFWIRGVFLLKENDILFWAILGLFVAINGVLQKRKKRSKSKAGVFSWQKTAVTSIKIVGMFILMSLLWGFWISPNITTWTDFIGSIATPTISDIATIALGFLAVSGLVTGLFYLHHLWENNHSLKSSLSTTYGAELGMIGLLLLGSPFFGQRIADQLDLDMQPILTTQLNKTDEELLFQGYYDELIVSNTLNSKIWEVEDEKPADWVGLGSTGAVTTIDGLAYKKLIPNKEVIFKKQTFTVNSQGLRDQEYALDKPKENLRFALLGGSMELGEGVKNNETFENVLERQLNRKDVFSDFEEVEILNFAISGLHMISQVAITQERVSRFSPDVLIYTAHLDEMRRSLNYAASLMHSEKIVGDIPYLDSLAKALDLYKYNKRDRETIFKLLLPHKQAIYEWGLAQIGAYCKKEGIVPLYVYLPSPAVANRKAKDPVDQWTGLAEKYGFYTINMDGIFDDTVIEDMMLAKFDKHYSAAGNKQVAERLFETIQQDHALQKLINQSAK